MIKDINIMAQPFKIIVIIFIVISIIIDIKMVLEEIKKKIDIIREAGWC